MGDATSDPVRLSFNPQLRFEFRGATVTSDAGLLLPRELNEHLGLSALIERHLSDPRTVRNYQFSLPDLFRQSIYSRLAGYEDTNEAERLAADPTFRMLASRERRETSCALTSTLHWVDTDVLTEERNYQGLARLNTDLVQHEAARPLKLGDRAWRELLDRHHALVRAEFARFRGREVDTAGDGVFGIFDGPERAIRCARSIRDAVRSLGIEIRAGLHTGECELMGAKVAGIAVHIGARVMAEAGPSEVLVSRMIRDLVAGSPFVFEDRGTRALKGVREPGRCSQWWDDEITIRPITYRVETGHALDDLAAAVLSQHTAGSADAELRGIAV